MVRISLFLFSVALALFVEVESKIPNYIHVCKRNDPKIEECIINSIEKLRPKLNKGIPDLEVPSLEPLNLPEIDVSRGQNFHAFGRNIVVSGASNFKITKLKADIDKVQYEIGITIPFLVFEGSYDVDAKVLVLPIQGKGPITANATDVIGDALLKGHKIKKNGETYLVFDTLELKLKLNNYNIHLGNLFNGDKNLGDAINAAINDNKKDLMIGIIPHAERVAGNVLLDIANKITKHFTFKELFPKD